MIELLDPLIEPPRELHAREAVLLEKINEMGTTIIMVTHDPELARRAHRNVQVVDGQISDFKPYEPQSNITSIGTHAMGA